MGKSLIHLFCLEIWRPFHDINIIFSWYANFHKNVYNVNLIEKWKWYILILRILFSCNLDTTITNLPQSDSKTSNKFKQYYIHHEINLLWCPGWNGDYDIEIEIDSINSNKVISKVIRPQNLHPSYIYVKLMRFASLSKRYERCPNLISYSLHLILRT